MKSLIIMVVIGVMFVVSANFMPTSATSSSPLAANKSMPLSTTNKPIIERQRKSQTNRLPRWHRVIPGMFR